MTIPSNLAGVVSYEAIELLKPYVAPSPIAVSGSSMGVGVSQNIIEVLAIPIPDSYISNICIEILWQAGVTADPVTPPTGAQTVSFAYVS